MVLVYDDAGSLENRFLYGPAVDQLFADEDALGEVLWALTDHQGTVRDLVEYDSGTDTTSVVNHVEYDSFGNITSQTNANEQPLFAFTGRYWDEDVQLQWNLHRWHEPSSGTWISPDPIGFAAGDTNLYRYVGNDPVNRIDPSGLTGAFVWGGGDYTQNDEAASDYGAAMDAFMAGSLPEDAPDWSDLGYLNPIDAILGEYLIRPTFSDEFLVNATDTQLVGATALLSTTIVTSFIIPTPTLGLSGALSYIAGGATLGASEYLVLRTGLYAISAGEAPPPTITGLATSAEFGGAFGALGDGLNQYLRRYWFRPGEYAEIATSWDTGIPRNMGDGRVAVPGTGPGGVRYPDLDPIESMRQRGTVIEVKDRARVYMTQQMRDELAAATAVPGGRLELATDAPLPTRGGITRGVGRGEIIYRPIPWPRWPIGPVAPIGGSVLGGYDEFEF